MSTDTGAVGAEGSLFEGLFRAFPPTAAEVTALKACQVDPARLEPRYRSTDWARALDAMRASRFPALSVDEGFRAVGRAFAEGFTTTLGGKMVLAAVPLLTVPTLLNRWPRFVKLGRSDVEYTATRDGERAITLWSRDQACVSAWFSVGILDYILERMRSTAQVRVELTSPQEFLLHYTW